CSVAREFTLAARPVLRSSTTATVWPAATSRSTTVDPMTPAPPVTRTLMLIWASLRADRREKPQEGAVEEIGVLEEKAVAARQHGELGAGNLRGQHLVEGRG